MNNLQPLLVLALILCTGFSHHPVKPSTTKWVINSGCSLKVAGSTNVSKFNCIILNYAKPDTLTLCRNNGESPLKIKGCLALDVMTFDCHHAMMTKDLRKALNAKEFPKLIITFISLNRYPDLNNKTDAIKGMVNIELAGVTKTFEIDYKFIPDGTKSLLLIGNRALNFSDFHITPPKKFGGVIQVSNDLNVEFNLKLKILENL